jgi:hypothetical protein
MFRALISGIVALLLCGLPTRAEELFPFVLPWDDASASATNVSAWLEAPAGRDGFVTVQDGHLFANGKRFRIFGVNVARGANFPTHGDAEKIAARLAKFGINCVRFHQMDAAPAPEGLWAQDGTSFDPEQLDRLDYFIAQLKTRGIYADLCLHVSRTYPDRPKAEKEGNPAFDAGVDNFSRRLIALQRDYARALLTHVNPYTKNAYINEPAIALIEINNENSLIAVWHSGALDRAAAPYRTELAALWTEWLRKKYGDDRKTAAAWAELAKQDGLEATVPHEPSGGIALFTKADIAGRTERARDDWQRFLWQTEERYWPSMHRFLREDLKAQSLIIGTQLGWSPFLIQQHMDVLAAHASWQPPDPLREPWDDRPWKVAPLSMTGAADGGTLPGLALQRVEGRPFVCTEYSHPAPNPFSAEAFPLLCAYAALQDWDGVFAFAYAQRRDDWARGSFAGFFDIDQHPVKMATLPASLALFLRCDVAPAKTAAIASIQHDIAVATAREQGPRLGAEQFGVKPMETFLHRVGVRPGREGESFTALPVPTGPKFTSDTGELTWDTQTRTVTINTPRSQGILGFLGTQSHPLQDVKIAAAPTRTGFSSILLTVLEGADFKTATRILLTAVGTAENTDMRWTSEEKDSVGTHWGHAPSLAEGIAAKITLPSPTLKAWALDERRQRRAEIPLKDGVLEISPAHRTLWYELAPR